MFSFLTKCFFLLKTVNSTSISKLKAPALIDCPGLHFQQTYKGCIIVLFTVIRYRNEIQLTI